MELIILSGLFILTIFNVYLISKKETENKLFKNAFIKEYVKNEINSIKNIKVCGEIEIK